MGRLFKDIGKLRLYIISKVYGRCCIQGIVQLDDFIRSKFSFLVVVKHSFSHTVSLGKGFATHMDDGNAIGETFVINRFKTDVFENGL